MNADEIVAATRADLDDLIEPYLWQDEELYSYLDDAQKMFCRKTDGLADATTAAVTTLTIVPGSSYLPLHKAILKIRGARRADTGHPLEVLNFEDLAAQGLRFDGRRSRVRALVIGEEDHKVRTYPLSNESLAVQLLVFRLPLVAITGEQPMEVDEEHHRHLIHWVKRQAYLKQDADAFDKAKSIDFEQRFLTYCAETKVEERRKVHKPRTVVYGGY